MEQLPLDIRPDAAPDLDRFIPGSNREALARVRALARGEGSEAIVYLWGPPGSGKSHLLRAAARLHPALVVADDVELLDADSQQRLFLAINAARNGQAAVLAAGRAAPAGLALREDLRTRLGWGLVYELRALTDDEKSAALQEEAARRGLKLGDDVAAYLLARLPRDLGSLHAVLEHLDRHSLARQRPLTLAMVRDALAPPSRPSGPGPAPDGVA